ncbi:hypothetical protein J4220_00905, partial [Candidatus Micrarchaeota archaeon]|nr:hypothetical protein [Candidatus Micrarchaeota archaeon]
MRLQEPHEVCHCFHALFAEMVFSGFQLKGFCFNLSAEKAVGGKKRKTKEGCFSARESVDCS